MKNARSTKAVSSVTRQGEQIVPCGCLPARVDTVVAEVLARLLKHERMTGLDAVSDASTTRLAGAVHRLRDLYDWAIETTDKAAGCRDGRMTTIAEYWLPTVAITAAIEAGAGEWCARVRAARMALRANAAKARRDAERVNASRLARRQWPGVLFVGPAHG